MDSAYLFDSYIQSCKLYKETQERMGKGRSGKPSPLLVELLSKERVGTATEHAIRTGFKDVVGREGGAARIAERGAQAGKVAAAEQ